MKPLDFYELGVQLASSAQTESEHRNAIGRLYYGLHHEACCRYFREHPEASPLQGRSRHREVAQRFRSTEDSVSEEISNLLSQLSRMRNVADYELGHPITYGNFQFTSGQFVNIASTVAEELLQTLEIYSPGEAPEGCDCPTVYSAR